MNKKYKKILHELRMMRWEMHIEENELYYIDEYNRVWEDTDDMNEYFMPDELLDDARTDWVYEDAVELYGWEVLEMVDKGKELSY